MANPFDMFTSGAENHSSAPGGGSSNTVIGTDLDMVINALQNAVAAGAPKQDEKTETSPAAPERPGEANCGGTMREVSYVQDKFIFGATGMADDVEVL